MKIYNFASVGTSSIGEEFMTTLNSFPQARLHTVYSRSLDKARSVSERFGAEHYTDSLEDICKDKEIDAVYIASPNSLHASQTEMMIDAGKHVFCEKPLFDNAYEVGRLTEKAKNKGVLLAEAYKTAYMPAMKLIKENIDSLGSLRSAFFSFGKYSSRYDAHKRGEDVNTFKNEFSNGGLLDMGIYGIYPILMLLGRPKEIKASASMVPGGVDGVGYILLRYDSLCACVHYSKVSDSFLPCEISGEKGTMTVDRINLPKRIEISYRNGDTRNILDEAVQSTENKSASLHTFEGMMWETKAFIESMDKGLTDIPLEPFGITSQELSLMGAEITDEARRQIGLVYPNDALRP